MTPPQCSLAYKRADVFISAATATRPSGNSMTANTAFHIAVLPGDGIGPEVMTPTLEILRRIEAPTRSLKFRFTEGAAGAGHYKDAGKSMPESTVKLCEEADAFLLSGCRLPDGGDPRKTQS